METHDPATGEIFDRITMPPEIAKAIIAVKKKVKQLGKDDENKFARFKYVSVDKFYDNIGPLMAEAGLFVICEEVGCDVAPRESTNDAGVTKTSVWLSAHYELTLFHETGVQYGPIHRMITVPATGPQAFGSGMSYVEKYFLRGLFKIPTGEQDADAEAQEGVPAVRGGAKPGSKAPATTASHPKDVEARKYYEEIRGAIATAPHEMALDNVLKGAEEKLKVIAEVSAEGKTRLLDAAAARRKMLQETPKTEAPAESEI